MGHGTAPALSIPHPCINDAWGEGWGAGEEGREPQGGEGGGRGGGKGNTTWRRWRGHSATCGEEKVENLPGWALPGQGSGVQGGESGAPPVGPAA